MLGLDSAGKVRSDTFRPQKEMLTKINLHLDDYPIPTAGKLSIILAGCESLLTLACISRLEKLFLQFQVCDLSLLHCPFIALTTFAAIGFNVETVQVRFKYNTFIWPQL